MDKLFESYVAKKLNIEMMETDYDVSTQDRVYYLFDEPERFKLRPDIVISKDSSKVILDTKWKNLYNKEKDNYGISQSDMYQMYAYSKKYQTRNIWLLYPLNQEMIEYKTNLLKPYEANIEDNVSVSVYFVDLKDIDNSISELKQLITK